jgi:hypothetical protein
MEGLRKIKDVFFLWHKMHVLTLCMGAIPCMCTWLCFVSHWWSSRVLLLKVLTFNNGRIILGAIRKQQI